MEGRKPVPTGEPTECFSTNFWGGIISLRWKIWGSDRLWFVWFCASRRDHNNGNNCILSTYHESGPMLGTSMKNPLLNPHNSLWYQQFLLLFLKCVSERIVQPNVTQLESGLSHAQTHVMPFPLPCALSRLEEEWPVLVTHRGCVRRPLWSQVGCLSRAHGGLCWWPQ